MSPSTDLKPNMDDLQVAAIINGRIDQDAQEIADYRLSIEAEVFNRAYWRGWQRCEESMIPPAPLPSAPLPSTFQTKALLDMIAEINTGRGAIDYTATARVNGRDAQAELLSAAREILAIVSTIPVDAGWESDRVFPLYEFERLMLAVKEIDEDEIESQENTLSSYLRRSIEWSRRTFGPGKRTLGISKHIRSELEEISEKPDDLSEWIDVVILAIDGYWRHGGKPETLMRDIEAKAEINYRRVYPMPVSDDEPSFHDKE